MKLIRCIINVTSVEDARRNAILRGFIVVAARMQTCLDISRGCERVVPIVLLRDDPITRNKLRGWYLEDGLRLPPARGSLLHYDLRGR